VTALEVNTTEDLVRQFAPDLIPRMSDARLESYVASPLVSMFLGMVAASMLNLSGGASLVAIAGGIIAGFGGAELFARREYRSATARFSRELRASPWRFYETVAARFAEEIERQRARTLGPNSDWGRARQPLEAAAQESARSVAYWEQRCAMDAASDVATQQLATARALHDKFSAALTQLDARANVLVKFFNECDARLATLQFAKRDHEEVRKLGALSEGADDIVTNAERTLAAIGSAFLAEAIRVGNALGGIERVGWLNLADTVPVDQIETLADRILDSSNHEQAMLDQLTDDVPP
jgi:hypothetical protein